MGALSPEKAGKILHDKSVRGHPLTKKQYGFFGAVAGGNSFKERIKQKMKSRGKA